MAERNTDKKIFGSLLKNDTKSANYLFTYALQIYDLYANSCKNVKRIGCVLYIEGSVVNDEGFLYIQNYKKWFDELLSMEGSNKKSYKQKCTI